MALDEFGYSSSHAVAGAMKEIPVRRAALRTCSCMAFCAAHRRRQWRRTRPCWSETACQCRRSRPAASGCAFRAGSRCRSVLPLLCGKQLRERRGRIECLLWRPDQGSTHKLKGLQWAGSAGADLAAPAKRCVSVVKPRGLEPEVRSCKGRAAAMAIQMFAGQHCNRPV